MSGITTSQTDHIVRSNLWTTQLKEALLDETMGMKYVNWLSDFPDGDTFNMVSLGQMEAYNYEEGQAIKYTGMDTGNFTFTVTDYIAAATYMTNKVKQDSFLASQIESQFVPKMQRAIAVNIETDIMNLGPEGQTASNLNSINGANHRWVASGTNQVIGLKDFALAKYSLDKANVPVQGRIAIVDPSCEYTLNTLSNLVSVQNNPAFEGIVNTGFNTTGMRFVKNIYGFDVYVSHFLKSGISETVNSVSVTNGVANLFFSAAPDVLPFVGVMRQAPKVDSEYNKDQQRDEYVTTCRYGVKLFRPENMVVVLTDAVQAIA